MEFFSFSSEWFDLSANGQRPKQIWHIIPRPVDEHKETSASISVYLGIHAFYIFGNTLDGTQNVMPAQLVKSVRQLQASLTHQTTRDS